jgi:hypothetical protein
MTTPVFLAWRLCRVWFVCVPACGDKPARTRWGLTFSQAARAAGLEVSS